MYIYMCVIIISDLFFGRKGAWWNLPNRHTIYDASLLTNRNEKIKQNKNYNNNDNNNSTIDRENPASGNYYGGNTAHRGNY